MDVNTIQDDVSLLDDTSESNSDNESEKSRPKDYYKLIFMAFILFGLVSLLPWNVLITASDYWSFKFRDVNSSNPTHRLHPNRTHLQKYFNSYLSIASNVPTFFMLVTNIFYAHLFSMKFRIYISLSLISILVLITTSFVKIDTDLWQLQFFEVTLITVVILSVVTAVFQTSITGLASLFPPKYMEGLIIGQAFAALFTVIMQIMALMAHEDSIQTALYYFLSANLVMIVSLFTFIGVHKNKFYKFYTSHHGMDVGVDESHLKQLCKILSLVWPYAGAILMTFWVSLSLFPGVAVLMIPTSNSNVIDEKLFIPICCFFLFNFGDICGRIAGNFIYLSSSKSHTLLFLSILRWLLVPFVMLCNIQPRNELPVIFQKDYYYIIGISFLGLSNGYIFVNAMVNATKNLPHELKEKAGFVLIAFLGCGVALGAFTSNLLLRLL